MPYISRRLVTIDQDGKEVQYSDSDFFLKDGPLIIIGEPGSGKSTIVKHQAETNDLEVYTPSDVQLFKTSQLINNSRRIIIDGLDEITAYEEGGPLVKILSGLSFIDDPNILITCRAVDWQHTFNTLLIKRTWKRQPIVGYLAPLDDQEILFFIQEYDTEQNAIEFIKEAEQRDVIDLLRNPQNLIMFLKTVQTYGWPETRSELFENACSILIEEDNEIHISLSNKIRPATDLLVDAAGFICAQLLLAGKYQISLEGRKGLNHPKVSELGGLGFGDDIIKFALSTKVFKVAGHDIVEPSHRTIAEFLAGNWLSAALAKGLSKKRLENLIYGNTLLVPTAIRGLYAWLATKSPKLIDEFIKIDPYGFIRYGDPSVLTHVQAKNVLSYLGKLSNEDPYFRSGDWHISLGKGLARTEFKNDILNIIRDPDTPHHFSQLIFESLQDASFVSDVKDELIEIVLDSSIPYFKRDKSLDLLLSSKDFNDSKSLAKKLCQQKNVESIKLSLTMIVDKTEDFSGAEIAEILIALETALISDNLNIIGLGYGLQNKMSDLQLKETLDDLSLDIENRSEKRSLAISIGDWILKFLEEYLRRGSQPNPKIVWTWLKHIDKFENKRIDWDNFSKEYFTINEDYRRNVQAETLNQVVNYENYWGTLWGMSDAAAGLWLHEEDIIFHLKELIRNKNLYGDWYLRWKDLVQWAKINQGFNGAALDYAKSQLNVFPELETLGIEMEPAHLQRQQNRLSDLLLEYKEDETQTEGIRFFSNIRDELKLGNDLHIISQICNVYLGRGSDLNRRNSPIDKVEKFVGKEVLPYFFEGLVNAVLNSKIPTPRQIAELHATKKEFFFIESILITYCDYVINNGQSLIELPDNIIRSTLASCRWASVFGDNNITAQIQKELEGIVFSDKKNKEAFVIDVIEPYLENKLDYVPGLQRLATDKVFDDISGNLAISFLRKFKYLSGEALKSIVTACIAMGRREEFIQIIRLKIDKDDWIDDDQKDIYFGCSFLLDFEHNVDKITTYVEADIKRLWPLKEITIPKRGLAEFWPELNSAQNFFIISKLAIYWPVIGAPSMVTVGFRNPWDAAEWFEERIDALANDISPLALEFLNKLVKSPRLDTYQDRIKHRISELSRKIIENRKSVPTLTEVRKVLMRGQPANIDDLQSIVLEELELLQRRIKDGPTNDYLTFWNNENPHDENYCRDRIVSFLTPYLEHFKIRPHSEYRMSDDNRCDFINTYEKYNLPVEIKGQWHPKIWTAALTQTQDYTRDFRSDGRGIFLVLWFGKIQKGNNRNPRGWIGQKAPVTLSEMRNLLGLKYNETLPSTTKIFILDLSR